MSKWLRLGAPSRLGTVTPVDSSPIARVLVHYKCVWCLRVALRRRALLVTLVFDVQVVSRNTYWNVPGYQTLHVVLSQTARRTWHCGFVYQRLSTWVHSVSCPRNLPDDRAFTELRKRAPSVPATVGTVAYVVPSPPPASLIRAHAQALHRPRSFTCYISHAPVRKSTTSMVCVCATSPRRRAPRRFKHSSAHS